MELIKDFDDYQVVRAQGSISDVFRNLRSKVLDRRGKGWVPIGGVQVDMSGNYNQKYAAQAMVKINDENDNRELLNE